MTNFTQRLLSMALAATMMLGVSLPSSAATATKQPNFSVQFIDVGQADAALIQCDGDYMLIDGGNKADSNKIYSVLKKQNVKELDLVVATHAHEDHVGGLPAAYQFSDVKQTISPVKSYDSKAFTAFANAANKEGGITIPKVRDKYDIGSADVTVLGVNSATDTNNSSIVLRVDYGKTSFLFTGDAERDAEQKMLDTKQNLSATVLKVGHHGSDTSTTYPFLRDIMPQYAVISVGKDNSYGHPTEAVLSRLRDANVKTYRTDMQGDITCTSDGKTVTFTAQKNKDANTFGNIGSNSTQKSANNTTDKSSNVITKEKKPTAGVIKQGGEVWIPQSGKKYHSSSTCSGMKNPSKVTREEAIAQGYTPCKKCY